MAAPREARGREGILVMLYVLLYYLTVAKSPRSRVSSADGDGLRKLTYETDCKETQPNGTTVVDSRFLLRNLGHDDHHSSSSNLIPTETLDSPDFPGFPGSTIYIPI